MDDAKCYIEKCQDKTCLVRAVDCVTAVCDNATAALMICCCFFLFSFFSSALISAVSRPIAEKLCHMIGNWCNFKNYVQNLGSSQKIGAEKRVFFGAILDDIALRSRISPEQNKVSTIGKQRCKLHRLHSEIAGDVAASKESTLYAADGNETNTAASETAGDVAASKESTFYTADGSATNTAASDSRTINTTGSEITGDVAASKESTLYTADSNATNTAGSDRNTINTAASELAADSADNEECVPPSVSNDSDVESCVIPILCHRLPMSHPVVHKVSATISTQVVSDGDYSGDEKDVNGKKPFTVAHTRNHHQRVWDKKYCCCFCRNMVSRLPRHLCSIHSDEVRWLK